VPDHYPPIYEVNMAASTVPHPLSSVALPDNYLAAVFQLEDTTLMSPARLEELATACTNDSPVASAYLRGLIELRLFGSSPSFLAG
jgi:hypothetical protein